MSAPVDWQTVRVADLRTELRARATENIPAYRMLLPPGWEAHDLTAADESSVLAQATARLASAQRPDLASALRRHVAEAMTALRGQRAFVYALAREGAPTWVLGAASLVGMKRVASPEVPLDAVVREAIERRGGVAIGEDYRIVRWTERRPVVLDEVDAVSTLIHYLIPIPGSRRTAAVQWTVTVAHGADVAADSPLIQSWIALFDGHIATFTWSNPA